MSERPWRVGLCGTFDVENYGDLLFPLIAEAELAQRLGRVELQCFSYRAKSAAAWPFPVTSVSELPRLAAGLDGLLVGGGHVVRFDKYVAPGYGPPTAAIHHPTGYWLTPALIALQHGIPLIWNAPGVAQAIPDWSDPLMALAFQHSSYVAVRDEPARASLRRFVAPDRVAVVPDTGFGVARRLAQQPSFELSQLRDAVGLTGPYVVLHAARGLDSFHRYAIRHADRLREYRILALPIGPALGDDAAIADCDLPGLVRLPVWPHPLLLAELIGQAAAVVGYSYHLAITALVSGVPVFAPSSLVAGKFAALEAFDTVYPLPAEHDPDADWFVSRLGKAGPSALVADALGRLDAHWDRIATVLAAGATGTQEPLNRFWQSLPGLLETAANQRNEALEALRSRAPEGEPEASAERIAELVQLLAQAREEIAARDHRIAALLASTSWRMTAPMRFVGRRLGR